MEEWFLAKNGFGSITRIDTHLHAFSQDFTGGNVTASYQSGHTGKFAYPGPGI